MAGGGRFNIRRQNIELAHYFMKTIRVLLHDFHGLELFESRFFGNLIFTFIGVILEVANIGYVSHIPYLIAKKPEVTGYDIEGEKSSYVAQVYIVVDGRSANIDSYIARINRLK
jgi:hypothetical protein